MKRSAKGLLALIGTVLFLGSVALLVLSVSPTTLFPAESAAAGGGAEDLPSCRWTVDGAVKGEIPADREFNVERLDHIVMSESQNLALYVSATPFEGDEECDSFINVNAPNFTSAPTGHYVYATGDSQASHYVFILSPQKAGSLMFLLTSDQSSYHGDVTVTNWMGLNPFWSQMLVGLGTVFGPMLTVPWWLDRRRESKEIKEQRPAAISSTPPPPPNATPP